MKSVILEKYRSELVIKDIESAVIDDNEVRIKNAYAGLSFTDRIIQQGLYKYQRQHMPIPYVPGFEASGHILEVGNKVVGLSVGDSVTVLQRQGCLNSEIIANHENVMRIPKEMDMALAASLPVNFFTASHALNNIVKIYPNSRLLISSAAGGVGGMLTQLASRQHCVTGLVGSQEKVDYVKTLGAYEACTYREFFNEAKKFDVILTASGEDIEDYIERLDVNGKIIIYGFHAMVPRNLRGALGALFNYFKMPSISLSNLVYENKTVSGFNIIHLDTTSKEFKSTKKQFLDLLEAGDMPNRQRIHEYGFKEINTALDDLADGKLCGKVVIKF
jgi:NADPH:quinone reductase-like Zn-dependent oxidoreductase